MIYDVAIVGGGPAGSSAAIYLARLGYSVVIADRCLFPRDKVCGDYITPGAVQILRDEMGLLPDLQNAGAASVSHQTIVAQNGKILSGHLEGGLSCPRYATDNIMISHAKRLGVPVFEGVRIFSIRRNKDGIINGICGRDQDNNPFSINAKIVIAADGAHSIITRCLDAVVPLPQYHRVALSVYVKSDLPDGLILSLPLARKTLKSGAACCGLGPACGKEGRRNLNVVVPASDAPAIAGQPREYLQELLHARFPHLTVNMEQDSQIRTIGCYGHTCRPVSQDHVLLIGDAAAFIHPFTGEGIFNALIGARLAASAIDRYFCDKQPLFHYDMERQRLLMPRYRVTALIEKIVHNPTIFAFTRAVLHKSPSTLHKILRIVGDIDAPPAIFNVSVENIVTVHGLRP